MVNEQWVSTNEAERQTAIPREILVVLSGNVPEANGTMEERSMRRRIVLDFWGRYRKTDVWGGPKGMLPVEFFEDVKTNNDAIHGCAKNPAKYDFDDLRGYPIFAAFAYVHLVVSDHRLKWTDLSDVVAKDLEAGPPWVAQPRMDARRLRLTRAASDTKGDTPARS